MCFTLFQNVHHLQEQKAVSKPSYKFALELGPTILSAHLLSYLPSL